MGEGTESLSQSLFAPLIPYEASYGRLKGLSGITMVRGSLSQSLFVPKGKAGAGFTIALLIQSLDPSYREISMRIFYRAPYPVA